MAKADRKFDLVLFGATGFTGKLTAKYIANQYGGTDLKWAIAGRSASKLEPVKAECKGLPEIIIADSGDEEAIRAMVLQTRVLLTTAGPFAKYGTQVVQACAELGTDYCDITGESDWFRDMIALYDDKAKASGARIVCHCGHDSIPWDLMTLMLAKKLKEKGESVKRVDMYDEVNLILSGGTIDTAMEGLKEKPKPKGNLKYDPLLKDGDAASTFGTKVANVSCVAGGEGGFPARQMFFMAPVNGCAVTRSNALLKYGDQMVYCEGKAAGGCAAAYCGMLGLGLFGCMLAFPPTRCCLQKYVLLKPGEGPTEEQMNAGSLTVTGVAVGDKGSKVVATLYFPVDPGYKDTARMLTESGLTFILEKSFACPGGVLTPAACQGEVLLNRLLATGCTFKYVDAVA